MFEGPSAVAFVEGDPVAAAKTVVDAAKKFPTLVLKGGFMDGKLLSADDAKALADLESREVMLSKIAGLMKGGDVARRPPCSWRRSPSSCRVLEAYKEKLPAEPEDEPAGEAEAAEPEAAAEPRAGGRAAEAAEPAAEAAANRSDDDRSTEAAGSEEGEE